MSYSQPYLQLRIPGESLETLANVQAIERSARLVKGAVVAPFNPLLMESWGEVAQVKLVVAEGGFRGRHTGYLHCWCAQNGSPFIPFATKFSCPGDKAFFSVSRHLSPIVKIVANWWDKQPPVRFAIFNVEFGIEIPGPGWRAKNLWEGSLGELPELFDHYRPCMEAMAVKVSNCYHFRSTTWTAPHKPAAVT